MPLPLRFVPRTSCLSSAYLLSVYEDCDWFCMAWRAGSGNRCCLPSCNGFEMGLHCIIDSSSGSLRRSLCVSFVVVCEDCAVSLLCWVRSVCFPSCLALRVCPCVLGCSRCSLPGACLPHVSVSVYCASAVPLQFTSNSAVVHLQCVSFPTNASQINTPHSSTRIFFLIRSSCSQVVRKWCLLLLVFCRKVASAVVAVIIRSLSLFKSPTLSVSLPAMVKKSWSKIDVEHGGGLVGMWGAHAVHERRRGGGERVESTVLFLEGGGVVVVLPVVSSCSHSACACWRSFSSTPSAAAMVVSMTCRSA